VNKKKEIWVEIEAQITEYRFVNFRGLIAKNDFDKIIKGNEMPYLKLSNCYWYNDSETENKMGTFDALGAGIYQNFTGEVYIRANRIIDISPLKAGLDGEPKKLPIKKSRRVGFH
jgi:hypothetical protein